MEEITINKISWSAPEYKHEEKSIDFLWTIGLIAIVSCGIAIWMKNYLFAIFIFISGLSLGLFSIRHPKDVTFSIETDGLTMGNDIYPWKRLKGFHIKKGIENSILLIETDKYFLPIYTIPLPFDITAEVKESILKFIPDIELEESKSMMFMEKLGF